MIPGLKHNLGGPRPDLAFDIVAPSFAMVPIFIIT